MTAYKKVPNSQIEVPVWMDITALTEKFSIPKRQRNAFLIGEIKKKWFGGAR